MGPFQPHKAAQMLQMHFVSSPGLGKETRRPSRWPEEVGFSFD